MPIPVQRQECCTKCSWKSKVIQYSDVVFSTVDTCPQCGGEITFKQVENLLEKFFSLLKK